MYDESTQHGSGQPSTIMTNLNNWYNSNLAKYEEDYIDTGTGFCSDRNMARGYNWSSSTVYYAPYDRQSNGSLQCNELDVLSQDNGKLLNPIGLLTSDEYVLAGSGNSYLDAGINYWTMSPFDFFSGYADVFSVTLNGILASGVVDWTVPGVRPVINLKADTPILSGDGSLETPFVITE